MTFGFGPIEIANAEDVAAGTAYYPSEDGVSLELAPFVMLEVEADDLTFSVEMTTNGTRWTDVTHTFEDLESQGTLGGPVIYPAGASTYAKLQGWYLFGEAIRVKAVYPNGTNKLNVEFARRGLDS